MAPAAALEVVCRAFHAHLRYCAPCVQAGGLVPVRGALRRPGHEAGARGRGATQGWVNDRQVEIQGGRIEREYPIHACKVRKVEN